jgi:hypothetical protein
MPSFTTIVGGPLAYHGGVPDWKEHETDLSARIGELLNPPALFPDTSRMAAEAATGRGYAGSPAGYSTAVRMTDEERLKRIALGNDLLTSGVGRDKRITPFQTSQIDLDKQRIELQRQKLDLDRQMQEFYMRKLSMPNITYGGGRSSGIPMLNTGDPWGGSGGDWFSGGGAGFGGFGSGEAFPSALDLGDSSNWWDAPSSGSQSWEALPGSGSPYQFPTYGQPPPGMPPGAEYEEWA